MTSEPPVRVDHLLDGHLRDRPAAIALRETSDLRWSFADLDRASRDLGRQLPVEDIARFVLDPAGPLPSGNEARAPGFLGGGG